ncbi:HAMP domain-containing protein [Ornithinibacillus sp. L9]|uniref:histidine kinase n=1 Tax=Ornithinibacillus caprae TaxID=2678566 RepID=A0A6N8FDI3_9BACI|nr:sensor histidine kinase [Ornithinibacillus caprae]MUK87722.1 HAMP domain-containing protein [Ornithinibacillus caprae]
MKTIRGKLLVYFLVFVLLFQAAAVSIFISSNGLLSSYHDGFERFLVLNSISQYTEELYLDTQLIVVEFKPEILPDYYETKSMLETEKNKLTEIFTDVERIELKNYMNLIDTFIHESELTIGFVLRNDIEQYTNHLEETRIAAGYIQEATLEVIDSELTAYQSFYKDLQERNESFFYFILFLFGTTSILAIFFALWFSKGITNPLNKLSRAAKEVSKGNLIGDPIQIQSNDELKLLGDTFNHMRSDIHRLVEEIKDQSELDRLIKEMELKHLQNQINPHFLFNTLNTISKMAYLEDAKQTSGLIDSVATLLRHSLGDIEKQVALKDEVMVVRDYFHIQKTRFTERVKFQLEVDESCLDTKVPRLTLQPLIENAFIHGIEEIEEGGTITLSIYSSAPFVVIEVSDDGVGMSHEKIKEIMSLAKESEDHVGHSTGIGLKNVIRRLQLTYQMDDLVTIESELGKGTTVRIKVLK